MFYFAGEQCFSGFFFYPLSEEKILRSLNKAKTKAKNQCVTSISIPASAARPIGTTEALPETKLKKNVDDTRPKLKIINRKWAISPCPHRERRNHVSRTLAGRSNEPSGKPKSLNRINFNSSRH
jgi:hypothetical protein